MEAITSEDHKSGHVDDKLENLDSVEEMPRLKNTGISFCYHVSQDDLPSDENMPRDGREFLINILDLPGQVDLAVDVSAALRVADGALVVFDCIEGMAMETEAVLRQALVERIRPMIAINKLDLGFLEFQLDWESMYTTLFKHVEKGNQVVSSYRDDAMSDISICPVRGNVAFSAGLHGWAFTIPMFARSYAAKFGISEEKMADRLWGDHYFAAGEKRWKQEGQASERAFNLFILDPIGKIFSACMNKQTEKLKKMLSALNIKLSDEELELKGEVLLRRTLRSWLPAQKALLQPIIRHLPSPAEAQRYRIELLYSGPLDDACAAGIRNCDPAAPLLVYVARLFPSGADKVRFHAFGRVYSGTVTDGTTLRIMGPMYSPGRKEDLFVKPLQRLMVLAGVKMELLPPGSSVPAGNIWWGPPPGSLLPQSPLPHSRWGGAPPCSPLLQHTFPSLLLGGPQPSPLLSIAG